MRALVTNDDGIESPGLDHLAAAATAAGFDVVVAAPSWDMSGAAASLTGVEHDGRLRSLRVDPTAHRYALDAAPAMITVAALRGAFGARPDLVLSGINRGRNTGRAILHSGTVGAAFTAASYGTPAIAVSIDAADPEHFETAGSVVRAVVANLGDLPEGAVLNVNVPDVAPDRVAGIGTAPLARVGAVQTNVTDDGQGYLHVTFGEPAPAEPGTDADLLAQGCAVLTVVLPVCALDDPALASLADRVADRWAVG